MNAHSPASLVLPFSLLAACASSPPALPADRALVTPTVSANEQVRIEALWTMPVASPGEEAELVLTVHIAPGFHAYGHKETTNIPVALPAKGLQLDGLEAIGAPVLPAGEHANVHGVDTYPLPAKFTIAQRVRVPAAWRGGAAEVRGVLAYQLCNDTACYPPEKLAFTARLPVRAAP